MNRVATLVLILLLTACSTPVQEAGVGPLPQQPYGFLAFELDARFVGRNENVLPKVNSVLQLDVDFGQRTWFTAVRISKHNDLRVLPFPVGNYRHHSFQLNDTRLGIGRLPGAFSVEEGAVTYIGRYDFRFDVGTTIFGWSQLQGFSFKHSNNIDAVRPAVEARLREVLGASAGQVRMRYSVPFE